MSHIPRPWPADYRPGRVNQASSIAIIILEDADRGKPGGPPIGDRGMTGTGEAGAVDQLPVVLRDSANKRKRLGSIRFDIFQQRGSWPVTQEQRITVFIPGIFLRGNSPPPFPKNLQFTRTTTKLCALNLLFGGDKDLEIYHGNFFNGQ